MTKFSLLGVLAFVGGGVLIGFQILTGIMGKEGQYAALKLTDVLDKKYFNWIGNSSFYGLEAIPEYIVGLPLFVLLFGLGVLFFLMNYIFGKK